MRSWGTRLHSLVATTICLGKNFQHRLLYTDLQNVSQLAKDFRPLKLRSRSCETWRVSRSDGMTVYQIAQAQTKTCAWDQIDHKLLHRQWYFCEGICSRMFWLDTATVEICWGEVPVTFSWYWSASQITSPVSPFSICSRVFRSLLSPLWAFKVFWAHCGRICTFTDKHYSFSCFGSKIWQVLRRSSLECESHLSMHFWQSRVQWPLILFRFIMKMQSGWHRALCWHAWFAESGALSV